MTSLLWMPPCRRRSELERKYCGIVYNTTVPSEVPSSKRSGHGPFKAGMLGSNPAGIIWVGRIAAIAADCKSADYGLRWFESNPAHFVCVAERLKALPC